MFAFWCEVHFYYDFTSFCLLGFQYDNLENITDTNFKAIDKCTNIVDVTKSHHL